MELHELSPFPVSVDWEGVEITLKPFDLRAMTWAERFFSLEDQGGYDRMNETLKNKHGEAAQQNAIVEVVFYLSGAGFQKHGIFTAKELKDKIREHENRVAIFNGLVAALAEIFKASNPAAETPEPELTGGAIFEFFKSMETEKEPQPKVNWAQIYTKLFASGGMSIDEFYSLTPKQVFAISEEVNYLDSDKLSIEAKLHGMKFKAPRRKEKQLIH